MLVSKHFQLTMCDTKATVVCVGIVSLVALVLTIAMMADSAHSIDEGSVGIYYKYGKLQDQVGHPGINWATPFVTEVKQINIRPLTTVLDDIRSITKDGISIHFNGIQIISDVNEDKVYELVKKFGSNFRKVLIFDRLSEHLRKFCNNHTIDDVYSKKFLDIVPTVTPQVEMDVMRLAGNHSISILSLVIPKPDIPEDIERNYKQVKVQWTEQLVALQKQKTEKIKKETESIKAVLDAERHKKVLGIEIQKNILQKEGEKNVSALNNAIIKEREENQANINQYKKEQEAEGNKKLYSEDYVRLQMGKALSQNTKFYFSGESSPLGAIFTKLLGTKDK